MATQIATPKPPGNTNTAQPTKDLGALSFEELQKRLKECLDASWLGFEREIKPKVAPLLYHLRTKLKAQGKHTGPTWGKWCDENLPLSRRTADRWADEYEGKKPETFSHKTKSGKHKAGRKDQGAQVGLSLANLSKEERTEFNHAVEALRAANEDPARICFNALVAAARGLSQQLDKGKKPPMPIRTVHKGSKEVQ